MSCIIVLGCYRSGTSAVAGALHHLGVMMGKEFDAPAINNPRGFYEDLEFKRLYKKLASGHDVDKNLEVLIRIREAEYSLWGVKDPQLCLILHKFVPLIKTDHKMICIRRKKEDISRSLGKAIGVAEDRYMQYVEYYTARMEVNISNYIGPLLSMEFDTFLANPRAGVQQIADFVGVPMKEEAVAHVLPRKPQA
jgi:hypothetical protein